MRSTGRKRTQRGKETENDKIGAEKLGIPAPENHGQRMDIHPAGRNPADVL